ncbi:FadR/GntR family transcriptional regulator [Oscillibacter sp.]|uniref:FadR/GntR family transcriptional regulator n=1 Tax=Oscillibacter sp. TaxID=1945593 RepID=UPI0026345489|nr:FadR/GntR family transcriptional regulator [Oscillibacter sp.]MDD3346563.1 FadR/GntR family transcriptional regulator [Oscillibacter sp.]
MPESIFETVREKESPLAEQAADQISQLIIDQQLTNGEKLPNEFDLAEQLNVGRGTVREAVKLLVARNVLEIRRGRGTFVSHQTGVVHDPLGFAYMPDQLRLAHELLDIRLNVEPWVASLAAQQASPEDIAELRALCAEIEALIHTGQNHLGRDEALHVRIASCTQNRVISKLLPVITYSVQLFGKLTDDRIYQETIDTHRRIVDAIANHDSDAAGAGMRQHLMGNLSSIAEQERLYAEGKSSEKLEKLRP